MTSRSRGRVAPPSDQTPDEDTEWVSLASSKKWGNLPEHLAREGHLSSTGPFSGRITRLAVGDLKKSQGY